MDPPHSDVLSGSTLIPADFSRFFFWKNTIHVTVFSGFPPVSTWRARAAFVEPGSGRTIFWSVTTRGLPVIAEPIVFFEPRRFRRRDRGAGGPDSKTE
jgi:hypothetical protein